MIRCKSCAYIQDNLVPRLNAGIKRLQFALDGAQKSSGRILSHELDGGRVVWRVVEAATIDILGSQLVGALSDVKITRDELELAMSRCTCGLQLSATAGEVSGE